MNNNLIISTEDLRKEYRSSRKKGEIITVINGIDFKVNKGDRIGIVGANGSGKSTFLKLLAGIAKPTNGKIETFGKVVTLMNLEDGFSLDLTGRENILLNGLLVGMNREKINKKVEDILLLADIGRFIDEPFFTYSAGMKFRLAFSIAMVAECDLLIVDELLMNGDISFQSRVLKALNRFSSEKRIATIFCSHVPSFLWMFSDKFYEMKEGKIRKIKTSDFQDIMIEHDELWKKILKVEDIFNSSSRQK